MNKANSTSPSWKYLLDCAPDLALLQEVGSFPEEIANTFSYHKEIAITKYDNPQKFNIVILVRGTENIRIANESEFIANVIKESCKESGNNTLYFEPGAPWKNGIVESFNIRLRDELLTSDIFTTLAEA